MAAVKWLFPLPPAEAAPVAVTEVKDVEDIGRNALRTIGLEGLFVGLVDIEEPLITRGRGFKGREEAAMGTRGLREGGAVVVEAEDGGGTGTEVVVKAGAGIEAVVSADVGATVCCRPFSFLSGLSLSSRLSFRPSSSSPGFGLAGNSNHLASSSSSFFR